jgi:hypothetical protein
LWTGTIQIEGACDSARREKSDRDAAYDETQRWKQAERERQRRAALKQPPLPAERNGLLGSWRLDDGQQGQTAAILGPMIGGGSGADTGLGGAVSDIANMVMSLEKGLCGQGFGSGVTFSPSTYSIGGNAGPAGKPIACRAGVIGDKPAIAAIPGDSHQDMMVFAFASPDRIVGDDGCVLVRSGASAANAAANTATALGKLAVGPDAGGCLCPDGRQLYVDSCYDEFPDANCGIVNMHLPTKSVAPAQNQPAS